MRARSVWKLVCGLALSAAPCVAAQSGSVALRVEGDAQTGYGLVVLHNEQPIAREAGKGLFSAVFENSDHACRDTLDDWKARQWQGDATHVTLKGEARLEHSNVNVDIEVNYDVLSSHVVRKRVRFAQANAYVLFCQMTNALEPVEPPAKFWSFDQVDNPGGAFREYYPAAGFRTRDGLTVGLLTDAGFRNHWTRMIYLDQGTRQVLNRIPDLHLYEISDPDERKGGRFQVRQTFGRTDVLQTGPGSEQPVAPQPAQWQVPSGKATVTPQGLSIVDMAPKLVVPFPIELNQAYTVHLRYRSNGRVTTRLQSVDGNMNPTEDLALWRDALPPSSDWQTLDESMLIWRQQTCHGRAHLTVSAVPDNNRQDPVTLEIEDLQVRKVPLRSEPSARMRMGEPVEKTSFIFVDDGLQDRLHDYRLASQIYLADALGFKGGNPEKVIYADTMMLSWVAGPESTRPVCVPSIYYGAAGEMYFRDSMFAANGLANRELNESIFETWALSQRADGAINALENGAKGHLEYLENDSTPLWLMWALRNHQRFGSNLPMERLHVAAQYCLNTHDPDRDGKPRSNFVMGQNDVIYAPNGITDLAENQGVWAVTLRTIKELGVGGDIVTDEYIARAEQAYRDYYDPTLKRVRVMHAEAGAIGFGEIFAEFLSLWLFQHKMLTDEMIANHLEAIPAMRPDPKAPYPDEDGTVRPVFIAKTAEAPGWCYFSDTFHPVVGAEHARQYANHVMDGMYYNGGSWMRMEVCGYVAGKLHGWKGADAAIANRLWAEINADPDSPTSQEYLPTAPANPQFGGHRVFAWNSFVLQAMEMAGLRTPDMDPDYKKPPEH